MPHVARKEHINQYKMAHMIGVAEYMRYHADTFNPMLDKGDQKQITEFRDKMYLIGLVHDIGYLKGRVGHEEYGAELIKSTFGDDMGIASQIIAEHGKDMFRVNPSLLKAPAFALLVSADYHIGISGHRISPDDRIAEIINRFPNDAAVKESVTHNLWYVKCVDAAMDTQGLSVATRLTEAEAAFQRLMLAEVTLKNNTYQTNPATSTLPKLAAAEADILSALLQEYVKPVPVVQAPVVTPASAPVKAGNDSKGKQEPAKSDPAAKAAEDKAPAVSSEAPKRKRAARTSTSSGLVDVYCDTWKKIAVIYEDTIGDGTPGDTVRAILSALPEENVIRTFAIVSVLMDHDKRIIEPQKAWAKEQFAEFEKKDPAAAALSVSASNANPMFGEVLDLIHPAHTNLLLGELRAITLEKANTVKEKEAER